MHELFLISDNIVFSNRLAAEIYATIKGIEDEIIKIDLEEVEKSNKIIFELFPIVIEYEGYKHVVGIDIINDSLLSYVAKLIEFEHDFEDDEIQRETLFNQIEKLVKDGVLKIKIAMCLEYRGGEKIECDYFDIFKWREEVVDFDDWPEYWQIKDIYAPDNDLFSWDENRVWFKY